MESNDAPTQSPSTVQDDGNGDVNNSDTHAGGTIESSFMRLPFLAPFLPTPASLYHRMVSKSPRLIGWNDDEFRSILEDHKKRVRLKPPVVPALLSGSSDGVAKATNREDRIESSGFGRVEDGFGLMGILADTVIETVLRGKSNGERKVEDEAVEYHFVRKNSVATTSMRDMELYQHALSSIKYQRDSYIMGRSYANVRKIQRESQPQSTLIPSDDGTDDAQPWTNKQQQQQRYQLEDIMRFNHGIIPDDSLAKSHLVGIASWFLPSATVVDSLRPTVVWLLSPPIYGRYHNHGDGSVVGGPLHQPFVRAVKDLVPLSQSLVDSVVKENVIWALKDNEWKAWMKGTTGGYVSSMQRDRNRYLDREVNTDTGA